jgi:cytochrome c oxidase subunit 4
MDEAPAHEEVSARRLLAIWAALVALTGTLVAANRFAPGNAGIVATMVITPTKVALVLWYFMHLREEGRAIRLMLLAAATTLVVFIGLLMLDYGFR